MAITKNRDPRITYDRFLATVNKRAARVGRPLVTEEIVGLFREGLTDLRTTGGQAFYDLGKIADKQSTDTRQQIAMAVCDQILKVPADRKLTFLHLLDLLVKRHDISFREFFQPRLPEVFTDAYKKADTSLGVQLVKLFKTWRKYFPSSVLQKIEDELPLHLQEIQKSVCSDNMIHTGSQSALLLHGVSSNLENKEIRSQPDDQCAMDSSSSRSFRKTSSFAKGCSSLQRLKLLSPFGGSGRTETSSIIQAEGALLPSRTAPPRIGLKRPNPLLSGDVFGRTGDWNGEISRSRPFVDGAHYHPSEDHRSHASNNSHEKFLKLQRPDYDRAGQGTTSRYMSDIAEECGYEVMSPTLSWKNRGSVYNLTPYPDTGLSQLNASPLGNELWSGPRNPSRFDHPSNSVKNGKCHDDVGSHTEGLRGNENNFRDQYTSNHVEAQRSINDPNLPQLVSGRTIPHPLVHPRHSPLPPSQPPLIHSVLPPSRPPPSPPHLVQPPHYPHTLQHTPHTLPPPHSTVMSCPPILPPPQSSQFTCLNSINTFVGSSQISLGAPSAYLQTRPESQASNTVKSESILSKHSGLIYSLIARGMISLNQQALSQGSR